ncbi:MAG: fibronectin type III domain-containing protein, partial [Bacteroidetes bacterium]|nr:fibronectin type III domain-containing protein [Fibrella sp.]
MKSRTLFLLLGLVLVSRLAPAQTSSDPAGLDAVARSSTRIDLSWRDNSIGELGFEIHRSTDNRTFDKINDAGPGAVSYQDATVQPSMRYYYKVRASLRGSTTTGFSNTDDATTPAAPPVANDLKATARNATTIDLTWTTSGKEPSYTVERSVGRSGRFTPIGSGSGAFTDNNLSPGTEYCYRVQYAEGVELGGYSNIDCATTQAPPVVVPVTPSGLAVSAISDTQLQVFWMDINVQAVTFEISRADRPGGSYQVIQPDYAQKIFDDKNLTASTQYCYRVRARNSAGAYSNYSTEACGTTKAAPVVVPDPPTNLEAVVLSPETIRVSWTATTSTFGTGYLLERATSPGGAYSTAADLAANQTTFTDTRLSPNTRYCYRVRTKYNATLSNPGHEVCATTQAPAPTVPNPPARLSATAVAFNQVNLGWADVSGNETGFEIQQ